MIGVQGLPSKEGSYWRTESRTPMQWDGGPNAGFSSAPAAQLYLPVEPDLSQRTVAQQDQDPASLLNAIRALSQLRRDHPALHNNSDFEVVYAQPGQYPFAFLRKSADERVLVVVNPADRAVEVTLRADQLASAAPRLLWGAQNSLTRTAAGWNLSLPPVSAAIYQL
jgi:glycosidase